jgi:hypothetical protein
MRHKERVPVDSSAEVSLTWPDSFALADGKVLSLPGPSQEEYLEMAGIFSRPPPGYVPSYPSRLRASRIPLRVTHEAATFRSRNVVGQARSHCSWRATVKLSRAISNHAPGLRRRNLSRLLRQSTELKGALPPAFPRPCSAPNTRVLSRRQSALIKGADRGAREPRAAARPRRVPGQSGRWDQCPSPLPGPSKFHRRHQKEAAARLKSAVGPRCSPHSRKRLVLAPTYLPGGMLSHRQVAQTDGHNGLQRRLVALHRYARA